MVSSSRKKTLNKNILFPPDEMKDSLKNIFSLDVKVTFGGSNVGGFH